MRDIEARVSMEFGPERLGIQKRAGLTAVSTAAASNRPSRLALRSIMAQRLMEVWISFKNP